MDSPAKNASLPERAGRRMLNVHGQSNRVGHMSSMPLRNGEVRRYHVIPMNTLDKGRLKSLAYGSKQRVLSVFVMSRLNCYTGIVYRA